MSQGDQCGTESSQGVLMSMILIMSSTLQRTLDHRPFARKFEML